MTRYKGSRRPLIFQVLKCVARLLFPVLFEIRVSGMENLPEHGPFILLPKHQRWEDVPLLGLVIPRPLYYIAKHELFINPVSSFFISSLGGIPLNRKRPMESRDSIINMFDHLANGQGVVIFPEGTYCPGHMGRGKTGLLKMIQSRLELPHIPVGIGYEKQHLRTLVHIRLGKGIRRDPKEIIDNFQVLVMDEIARLSGLKTH